MTEDALPELLQTIEAELGYAAMLTFAHAFGGQVIYVPQNPGPDSPLSKQLGEELARDIARIIGSGKITVPLGPTTNQERFKRQIRKLLEEGKSANAVARALHIHELTARRHRRKLKSAGDGRQSDLFKGHGKDAIDD